MTHITVNLDLASRLFGKSVDLRKAQASTLPNSLGGEKRFEYLPQVLVGNAAVGVTDRNRYEFACGLYVYVLAIEALAILHFLFAYSLIAYRKKLLTSAQARQLPCGPIVIEEKVASASESAASKQPNRLGSLRQLLLGLRILDDQSCV